MRDKKKKQTSLNRIFAHGTTRAMKSQKVKPKIKPKTIVKCALCGKLVTQNQRCQRCGKTVCKNCAKTDDRGRYCPACFNQIRSVSKLA